MRTQRTEDNLLGRWAEPREVAYPILFLACDESSYVTGATLLVDAGKSIL
jgi:meso-butanediol dehydrogenase/(S,S)-butanediol dehydrogenase/diacetyl reductase